jgi:hypothetical protein
MTDATNRFYEAIEAPTSLSQRELIELFAYHLLVERGEVCVTAGLINDCFEACDLTAPSRTAQLLSEGVKSGEFVKAPKGYKLQRHHRDELAKQVKGSPSKSQSSTTLRLLEAKITAGKTRDFLKETIDCFEVGANRAAIVMCWILTIEHLIEHTMNHHLSAFNTVLSGNTDRRVKVTSIRGRDDFGDIPEGKLIEFWRSSGIISNDVRKILEEKLGVRNSSAHPSSVAIKTSKVIEFVDDLVENVVLKYVT